MRTIITAVPLALVSTVGTSAAPASAPPVSVSEAGLAIGGYDAVSYFSEDGPVAGSAAFAPLEREQAAGRDHIGLNPLEARAVRAAMRFDDIVEQLRDSLLSAATGRSHAIPR